ncbi:TetR family transcriptional regulator [Cumulibacter soli]|uniref:TetR family transcriptional regulator n=1 Tax=Cumulibacter soli TaxID=2546344 RepID=UPI0014198297|nr:TetR family transcriptional regulator [Cumulibacter soli]
MTLMNDLPESAPDPTGRGTSAQAMRIERVLRAAIDLAAEGGYEAVQMREVARRAGIAMATLYRYYPSKEELIRGAILSELGSLRADLRRRPARQDSPAGRTGEVFARGFRAMLRNPGFAHAAMSAHQTPQPLAHADSDQPRERPVSVFADIAAEQAWGDNHVITEAEHRALQMVQTVWVGSTVSWLNGLLDGPEVERRIRLAASKLLD